MLFGRLIQSAHGCFGRPKVWYGCSPKLNLLAKWEYEIVSKRVSELLFFFNLCVRKNFWERTNKFECCFFGWVSLTRLKFNTSFFWSYKNRHRLLIWLVMSQVTDSMCKYAHNSYFNNWSGDNASNKITCSLWDTFMCTRKSLLELWVFFEQSLSPDSNFFFWLSVGGKLSLFCFEEKLSPGVLDLVTFSIDNFFVLFEKDALRLWSNIFETSRFAPRKISRWNNSFVFNDWCFCTS